MSSDSELERLEALFQAAADLPAGERPAYLERECADAPRLRSRVEAMLADLESGTSLGPPTLDLTPPTEGPGSIIGRYKLLQRIGEGGFGVVYMAEQQEPVVRRVALKIIKLGMDSKEVVARFEAERQALALMDHPNIAKVLDGGATETGRPFFVMELVRGVSVTEYCDQNNLPTQERLRLFFTVCQAVQHAHHKGVIHRDLKPSNVMVTLHDGQPVPKVIDFGVAKAMHARLTSKTLFTAYERFIGTPAYMSPEQAELSGLDVDTRTDIYSLGVLLYELLTGTTPFDAGKLMEEGLFAIQRTIREEAPQRPSVRISTSADATIASRRCSDPPALSKLIRGDLDWIVMRCLEKERVRRYETASELAADIDRHLRNEPVSAGPPSTAYRLRKFLARNRAAVLSGLVLFVALVGGIVGTSLGMVEAAHGRRQAQQQAERATSVTNFLIETLALTDPNVALGVNLSVATLLDNAAPRLSEVFAEQPEAEARLRMALGSAYKALGEIGKAERNLRLGVDLALELPEFDQVELYDGMWHLTGVLFSLERPEAMQCAQHARRVAHDLVRRSHPKLATELDRFISTVNDAAFSADKEAAARLPKVFEDTVRASDAALPVGDPLWPIVAHSWLSAGYSVWFGPLDPISESFYARTLEIQQRELPANHPAIGETVGQLVGVLNRKGRADQAENAARQSVTRLGQVLPPESPQLAMAKSMLGETLTEQGKYAEAEPFLLAAHEVVVAHVDAENVFSVADSYARVVQMYEGWGKEARAAPYRETLTRICAESEIMVPWGVARLCFGSELSELRDVLTRLDVRCGGPAFAPATAEAREADLALLIERARRTGGELDKDVQRSVILARNLVYWARMVEDQPVAAERRAMLEAALAVIAERSLPFAHEVADAHAQSAELCADTDRERALDHAKKAWNLMRSQRVTWILAMTQIKVARSLVALELYVQAEELLLPCHDLLVEYYGPRNRDALSARDLLYRNYLAWGKPNDAQAFAPQPTPDAKK